MSKNTFRQAWPSRSVRAGAELPSRASSVGRSTQQPYGTQDVPRENLVRHSAVPTQRPLYRPLFGPMDLFAKNCLNVLPAILDELMPLSRAHRADLPNAVRELSALLTSERSRFNHSYWSTPRFVSAYLRYFLPWNLTRLVRLFPFLPLPELPAERIETEDEDSPAGWKASVHIADLGSGPLTLPIALWLSRPDWRAVPLTLLCADTSPRPLELGRRLLELMAAQSGEPLRWRVRLLRAPLERALRETGYPLLITAGNVLNESKDKAGMSLAERMAGLASSIERILPTGGRAFFVEPGTRLGGTLTASLRGAALEEGLIPLAPCPHTKSCPLLGRRSRGWCHASQDAGGPPWLAALSKTAGLPKDSLNLSFLLLAREDLRPNAFPCIPPTASGKAGISRKEAGASHVPGQNASGLVIARILSDAFPVSGMGYARYACTEHGLALIPHAESLPSGSLVLCRRPEKARRDGKSGAVEIHWETETS